MPTVSGARMTDLCARNEKGVRGSESPDASRQLPAASYQPEASDRRSTARSHVRAGRCGRLEAERSWLPKLPGSVSQGGSMRLNQVTMPCTDLAASVRFYTALGLRQILASDH